MESSNSSGRDIEHGNGALQFLANVSSITLRREAQISGTTVSQCTPACSSSGVGIVGEKNGQAGNASDQEKNAVVQPLIQEVGNGILGGLFVKAPTINYDEALKMQITNERARKEKEWEETKRKLAGKME